MLATGRDDLAVAPPREHEHVAGVLERRQRLAVAEGAELNGAAADDGQPAAVRMELNPLHRWARRQDLPRRTCRELIDSDRLIRLGECDQPAIQTERGVTLIA